jgi:hypothetical protein
MMNFDKVSVNRATLDKAEAEIVAVILEAAINEGRLPDMRDGEWGIARAALHRIQRALEPERTVLTEEDSV